MEEVSFQSRLREAVSGGRKVWPDGKQSCLLIGMQRGDHMHLDPIGGEAGPLEPGDELILLSRVVLDPSSPLPTNQ